MNENRIKTLSLLGMARKAGKLSAGFEAVKASALRKKAKLIICSSDLSAKTIKEIKFAAGEYTEVSILKFTSAEISNAVGTKAGCIAVCDEGFAKAIKKLINGLEEE